MINNVDRARKISRLNNSAGKNIELERIKILFQESVVEISTMGCRQQNRLNSTCMKGYEYKRTHEISRRL